MTDKIRWGILGPGTIAKDFFAGSLQSASGVVTAIGARNPDKPGLAEAFPGTRIHASYEALLDDPDIDAVYIATPHPHHAEWAIKAAAHGKHVLCEKPMSLTAAEAEAMIFAAAKAGTFMGEAYMYRLHPLTLKLVEIVKSGVLGEVRKIISSFGFQMPSVMPQHRLFSADLAGGGILDVGGYPLSMVRLLAGVNEAKGYAEPAKLVGAGHIGTTGVDESASAILTFANGILAEISCSIMSNLDNVLRVIGSQGRMEVTDFWFAGGKPGGTSVITITAKDGSTSTVEVEGTRHLYSFEIDAAGAAIKAGKQEFSWPGMTWAESLSTLRNMDQWRASLGLIYPAEQPGKRPLTIRGETLKVHANRITRTKIPGLEKDISKVALGFLELKNYPSTQIMLDEFYEQGGNLFDTAHMYGNGVPEKYLGHWMKSRGLREELAIIAKGVHTPVCYPDVIARQLAITLDRLQTDHVDVYFMHRDNPDIPVGEFVDAMDAEVRAGRIRGPFGGSNWSRERMVEASVLSNNFSLAEMVNPVWDGCISAKDKTWRDWLKSEKVTNFAWSSQARGFFTDRAGPNKLSDEELVRCWYSEANFARRQRTVEMAQRLGKEPIHVALAFCMAQDFGVVPLIGPQSVAELHSSLDAFDIHLTPEDVIWLEGGE
jgi:predicted dehydrogenase/aryl-alcohol dehydrogenase-like predicted oxidoreductase